MYTISCYNPKYSRNNKVRERTNHSHEELSFMVDFTPWLQSTEERLSRRNISSGLHMLRDWVSGVSTQDFLSSSESRRSWRRWRCWCFAMVGSFFDEDESKDEQSSGESSFHVEKKSPRVATSQHVACIQGARCSETKTDYEVISTWNLKWRQGGDIYQYNTQFASRVRARKRYR